MDNKLNFYLYPGLEVHAQIQIRRKLKWDSKALTPEDIINVVADVFDVTKEDILSSSRMHSIHKARVAAQALMRHFTSLPFKNISHEVGRTNHATAMYNIDQSENWLRSYKEYKKCYNTAFKYCSLKQNTHEQATKNF